MNKNLIFVIGLIACLRNAVAQPLAPAIGADRAITGFCEALTSSFNGSDLNRALSLASTNIVITWQNNDLSEGPNAVKAHIEKMTKGDHPILSKVISNPKILGSHIQGDFAILWGELNDHFILTDGRDLPLNSHFTASISNHGEGWKVTAFHVSVDAFSNPITAMAVKKIALIAGIGGIITGAIVGLVIASLLRRPKSSF